MARFQIPGPFRPGLAAILGLAKSDQIGSLIDSLKDAKLEAKLSEHVSEQVDVAKPAVADILKSLRSLRSLYEFSSDELDLPQFVDEICEAMEETKRDDLRPAKSHEKFKAYLVALLDLPVVVVSSKAAHIRLEHQHNFCAARILTDIRPVFPQKDKLDETDLPMAAILVHDLKITYHEGRQLKEIYVALDEAGLAALRDLIERAETKGKILNSVLQLAGVPNLG